MTLQLIVFIVLALFIAVCSVLAVTTSRILRAATYLLFVLFGTAGIYFQLNYSFLGAVQLLIYAGGITVLYVFSILLTCSTIDSRKHHKGGNHQIIFHVYHKFYLFLAIRIPPTMQASNNTLITSKGRIY